jgi:hypothetical protein
VGMPEHNCAESPIHTYMCRFLHIHTIMNDLPYQVRTKKKNTEALVVASMETGLDVNSKKTN